MFKLKNKKNFIKLLAFVLLAVIIGYSRSIFYAASDSSKSALVTFTVKVVSGGNPVSKATINHVNLQKAYLNIEQGNISSEITKSASWYTLTNGASNTDSVQLANGLSLGKGIPHNDSETRQIIQFLFAKDDDLLQLLNGNSPSYRWLLTLPAFHAPNNEGSPYTDANGQVVDSMGQGITAIIKDQQLLELVDVTPELKNLTLDLDQVANSGVTINITNPDKSVQNSSQYAVEYGQEIDYQIVFKKNYVQSNTNVQLYPSTNLVIDSISVPNQKYEMATDPFSSSYYPGINVDANNISAELPDIQNAIGQSLLTGWIYNYQLTIPASSEDVTVDVKAHITPSVTLTGTVAAQLNKYNVSVPVNAYQNQDAAFNIIVQAENSLGSINTNSQSVVSTGINFAMVDGKKDKFVQGAQYVLGKVSQGQKFLYSPIQGWIAVGNDLSNINPENYWVLSGNSQYIMGANIVNPIPLNTSDWNFNAEKQTQTNQSLIQIRGLGQGEKYFLYEVTAPKGYSRDTDIHYFSVFYKPEQNQPQNGTTTTPPTAETSVGYAENQIYTLNHLIPDYSAGTQEYNAISVTSGKVTNGNPTTKIILYLGLIILAIIVIGILLIIVF